MLEINPIFHPLPLYHAQNLTFVCSIITSLIFIVQFLTHLKQLRISFCIYATDIILSSLEFKSLFSVGS